MCIPFASVILLLGIYPTDISSSQIYVEKGLTMVVKSYKQPKYPSTRNWFCYGKSTNVESTQKIMNSASSI